MLRQINIMIEAMRKDLLYRLFCHREILEDAYTAHTEILAALKAQDFNGCITAVVGHIDTTKDHTRKLRENIGKGGGETYDKEREWWFATKRSDDKIL